MYIASTKKRRKYTHIFIYIVETAYLCFQKMQQFFSYFQYTKAYKRKEVLPLPPMTNSKSFRKCSFTTQMLQRNLTEYLFRNLMFIHIKVYQS